LDIKLLNICLVLGDARIIRKELLASGVNGFFKCGLHGHGILPVWIGFSGKNRRIWKNTSMNVNLLC